MLLLESPTLFDADVSRAPRDRRRGGTAAVEFAVCMPWVVFLLVGIWEVGRMVEVNQVMWGAAREGARQCSTGEDDFTTVALNVCTYLQNAEPSAVNTSGHTVIYTKTVDGSNLVTILATLDTPLGSEVYTITFQNRTVATRNDPKTMTQLDKFQLGVSMPYTNVQWSSTRLFVQDTTRLNAVVNWYSLKDTPIIINPVLPAQ